MGASTFEQDINYTNAANFTFPAQAEMDVSGGRLKDLRPAGGTFHSKFEDKDGTWGNGDLTGTLNGTAAVAADALTTPASAIGWWRVSGTDNMPSGNSGCIRIEITPGYSGAPPASWHIFSSSQASNNINSLVRIQHIGTNLRFDIYSSAGVALFTSQTGNVFNPVSGTKYEIEINWNGTNFYYFLNGILTNGVQVMSAGTQGARGIMRIGNNYLSTPVAAQAASFGEITIFDAIQHTSNYTPFQTVPYQYSKDGIFILNNSGVTGDAIDDLEEVTSDTPANTEIRYMPHINGQDKYWDGDSWEDSDGSISQSNDLATVVANKEELDLSLGADIKVKVLLISLNGKATPEITQVTLSYNFFNTQAEPPTCTVWGFYRDVSGQPVEGVTVTFKLKRSNNQYREAGDAIIEKEVQVVTTAQGRFESDLIRSSAFEHTGVVYEVTFFKAADSLNTSVIDSSANPIEFDVPDVANINLTDQITAVA